MNGGESPRDRGVAKPVGVAAVVVVAVFGAALLLVRHPELPLLVFAGALGALFIDALARPLTGRLHIPRAGAIAGVVLASLLLATAAAWWIGPQIAEQATQLGDWVPRAFGDLTRRLPGGELVDQALPDGAAAIDWNRVASVVFGGVAGIFSSTLAIATGLLAWSAVAIFMALEPERYLAGALLLVPRARRARVREVLAAIANALRWWLIGRAIAMAIVALITGIGLAALEIPLALTLALLAGAFTFIPYVGPVLAAVPAVAVALTASEQSALLVVGLACVVQLLENYVVTPVVQGRTIALAPALLVVAQVGLGVLLGGLGLVLATPLAVTMIIAVQAFYVQDALGDSVRLLGEGGSTGAEARKRHPQPS